MNLLFVCTGNTCRSPAAEVLARAEADRLGLRDVGTASAGSFAFPDQPAAGVSIAVARERGLDLESHRSRELGLELLEWATHVITMTGSHARAVHQLAPEASVYLLTDFLPSDHPAHGQGIVDPFGGDLEVYEQTYRELDEAVEALFARLSGDAGDAP